MIQEQELAGKQMDVMAVSMIGLNYYLAHDDAT